MKHSICTAFVLAFFCILSFPVNAQKANISTSGNRFLEICSALDKPTAQLDEMDFLNAGICEGYMLGLDDGVGMSFAVVKNASGSMEDLGACVPPEVELRQTVHIVLKYIKEHPEQAHERTATLVVLATKSAFPCAKAAQKP
ncbi:MAG: hypothetical protein LAP86_16760 [Acidobacteriia bacterium]|nr:hypothetical protein [Terriglobia bacterium]